MKPKSIVEMSNEELALYSQVDLQNEVYCEALCKRFEPLFKKGVTRWFVDGFTYDDYLQEGRIAVLKAARSFDPCTNRYFAPLVARTFHNRMSNLVRRRHAKKRGLGQKELSLGSYHEAEEYNFICEDQAAFRSLHPGEIIVIQELHTDYFSRLSTLERAVHYHHQILGESVEEVMKSLGISKIAARGAIDRCRVKLIQILNEEESNP
ncbi:sigma-70 family RNA polymerase sigma factor [Dolosicoccus paucivorans]|uniref:Sigma-70 family RNA polymerase sigma factor n=1 Tax=Dolosicoccus paucivorans TaxID=84521 RepID=A0A1G8K574_9LACT|nr:sigma-70 family RNA polymerase sigma factor [Dolosicoccus paucivorans]PMB84715.1 sigma-70 family RNA polymerase sigma factor [Dolosicoccus paucivorans]PMC58816.1 sigma-70 family RNA polymerase sigma factor [Dolosicoccus paucivorans]SDI38584.1 RNA polymerase sigma factor, sigma-70 family [Dolosicoccus paucivorans]